MMVEERLAERAEALGAALRARLRAIDSPRVKAVRGRGLLCALVVDGAAAGGPSAGEVCVRLRDAGLLTKPTHGEAIRVAPPLVLSEEQLHEAADVIERTLLSLDRA